jgi:phage recombination protein Bet
MSEPSWEDGWEPERDEPETEQPPPLEDPDAEARSLAVPQQPDVKAIEVAFTPEQKEIVKQLNPDLTIGELQVYLYTAARTGLDPIARQIYAVKRSGRMVIQTGIDGYRLIAARTGQMAGSDDPVFEEKDGHPTKATVTVWMIAADGGRYPYTASARWSEYAPPDLTDKSAFMWVKMPHTMLGKCAEALALRKAQPAELSGIYTDVEMAQAAAPDQWAKPANTTDIACPACGKGLVDNREAHTKNTKQPAWKCGNVRCQGGGPKKGGGNWPWASWDETPPGDPTTEGDYDGELTVYTPPTDAVAEAKAVAAQAEFPVTGEEVLEQGWATVYQFLEGYPPTKKACLVWLPGLYKAMHTVGRWPEDALDKALDVWVKFKVKEGTLLEGEVEDWSKDEVLAFTHWSLNKARKDAGGD